MDPAPASPVQPPPSLHSPGPLWGKEEPASPAPTSSDLPPGSKSPAVTEPGPRSPRRPLHLSARTLRAKPTSRPGASSLPAPARHPHPGLRVPHWRTSSCSARHDSCPLALARPGVWSSGPAAQHGFSPACADGPRPVLLQARPGTACSSLRQHGSRFWGSCCSEVWPRRCPHCHCGPWAVGTTGPDGGFCGSRRCPL